MGITTATITIKNPTDPKKSFTGEFLVDTGASFTILPRPVWKKLGLTPQRKERFSLADGTVVVRPVGNCLIEFEGKEAANPVVLGSEKDASVLGVITLESLGLIINPFTRQLRPARLML
jgi:clan AA aspartic protease